MTNPNKDCIGAFGHNSGKWSESGLLGGPLEITFLVLLSKKREHFGEVSTCIDGRIILPCCLVFVFVVKQVLFRGYSMSVIA